MIYFDSFGQDVPSQRGKRSDLLISFNNFICEIKAPLSLNKVICDKKAKNECEIFVILIEVQIIFYRSLDLSICRTTETMASPTNYGAEGERY